MKLLRSLTLLTVCGGITLNAQEYRTEPPPTPPPPQAPGSVPTNAKERPLASAPAAPPAPAAPAAPAPPPALPVPPTPPVSSARPSSDPIDSALDETANALRQAERQARMALEQSKEVGARIGSAFNTRLKAIVNRSSEPGLPSVVRFTSQAEESNVKLAEDLPVMGRVLENALDQALGELPPEQRMGITLWNSQNRSIRPLYLEDYGALFLIRVNIPVVGGAAPKAAKDTPATDDAWERARRDLQGLEADDRRGPRRDEVRFDPAAVDALQGALLKAFKQAANIRSMKPEDRVAFVVSGPGDGDSPVAVLSSRSPAPPHAGTAHGSGGGGGGGGYGTGYGLILSDAGRPEKPSTVLTLRARFEDIQAFADGKLDLDAFRARTSGHRYVGLAQDSTGRETRKSADASSNVLQRGETRKSVNASSNTLQRW